MKKMMMMALLLLVATTGMAQLKDMGLPKKATRVRTYDNIVYAATADGIYQLDATSLNGWQPFGFSGVDVRDFVMCDGIITVLCDDGQAAAEGLKGIVGTRLLQSIDEGNTWTDITPIKMDANDPLNTLAIYFELVQQPDDPNSIYYTVTTQRDPSASQSSRMYRTLVGQSHDGGKNLTIENTAGWGSFTLDYNRLSFDPTDKSHILMNSVDHATSTPSLSLTETTDGFKTFLGGSVQESLPGESVSSPHVDQLTDVIFLKHDGDETSMIIGNSPSAGIISLYRHPEQNTVWRYQTLNTDMHLQRLTTCPANGNCLYGVAVSSDGHEVQLWRSSDGISWEQKAVQTLETAETSDWQIYEKDGWVYLYADVFLFCYKSDGVTGIPKMKSSIAGQTGQIYRIDGTPQKDLQRGLNIMREADGSVRKVIVR